ncbi:MAG: DMT family transporter [Rhodocyclaceae bacterium]|jgi:drug/metabolite transporter (DMT)-like permease|nr:DMT family transporter [Rhodocyclaceae bacterium]
MGQQQKTAGSTAVATVALLTGATVWGLIWYPYRAIEQAGISGTLATLATYAVALLAGLFAFRRDLHGFRFSWWLPAIALVAGGCNLGYVLAVLHGEVMRVLLLFYLSPLWTVALARLLLDERLRPAGAVVIGCSVLGAAVMLWRPELGLPWPRNGAEWLGLGAGFCFALQNVLIRRTAHLSIELKTVTVFAGVIVLGLALIPFEPLPDPARLQAAEWTTLLVVGLLLLAVNLVVQAGLTALAANQAIVIMLFELVVAALSAWWLAGELTGPAEWLGGALIVAASLFSGTLEERPSAGS